ncbi:MAG: type I polyketide synthase, partial [Nocardiopsaceae bacterium]|nr:type I polyketide synthase [Nocardiopsaceae bacterium]
EARAASDPVLAVIRGSAVNHDGRSSGLTVPSPEAQQDVIRRSLAQAGVGPQEVTYAEAHGTGTSLGDPIELRALDAVLGDGRPASRPLLVGSVKTNVGHLEPAAGIAGLFKVMLSLRHGEIPPHRNLGTPNPKIPWRRIRIEVPTVLTPWPEGSPRIATVSSFGASGTNAHVVVSAPDAISDAASAKAGTAQAAGRDRGLLVLSARTPESLRALAGRYAGYLETSGHATADVCFTSQVGRARHAHGLVTAGGGADIAGRLHRYARGQEVPGITETERAAHAGRSVGWLLTGQGAQYAGMAAGLREEPAFAGPFRECAELLDPLLPRPLADVIWGDPRQRDLDNTAYTQPALFALEYALGQALLGWGARPAALLGHSVGEIAAACLAGALDLPDAARLVAARARLMAALPPGGVMAATDCDEATAREAIGGRDVSIGAINGPADLVLSGAGAEVKEVADILARGGYRVRFLPVSHAFHSRLMEPMLADFGHALAAITVRQPEITLISDVTGQPWGPAEL